MKNIQVIDGALNSVYDIFSATEDAFSLIFPAGQDIAFIDEVMSRVRRSRLIGQLPGRKKLKTGSRLLVSRFPEIKFILSCCGVL